MKPTYRHALIQYCEVLSAIVQNKYNIYQQRTRTKRTRTHATMVAIMQTISSLLWWWWWWCYSRLTEQTKATKSLSHTYTNITKNKYIKLKEISCIGLKQRQWIHNRSSGVRHPPRPSPYQSVTSEDRTSNLNRCHVQKSDCSAGYNTAGLRHLGP